MRRFSPSLLVFISLQILLCFVLLASFSGSASAQGMRTWPVPPFPKELLKGQIANDATTYVEPWQNYLIYLAIVLVVPLIYGLVLFLMTILGCCFRCCVHCCPGPFEKMRRKNMSKLKIRIYSLLPYSLGYAIILVCTALGIAFFLWFLLGEINVRSESFSVAQTAITLPDQVVSSTKDITGVVPEIMTDLGNLIDDVTSFSKPIKQINSLLNDTKQSVNGVKPKLEANKVAFQKVKDRQTAMANRTSGEFAMQTANFGDFNSAFQGADALISDSVDSGFTTFENAINNGLEQVDNAVGQVKSSIGTMNGTIDDTLANLVSKVETFMDQGKGFYEKYLTKDDLETYQGYVKIAEAVFGVVVIVIITLAAALMTFGFLCVFLQLWPCLKCLDCCAALCIIAYAIVGALCLFLWFLTGDICTQQVSSEPKDSYIAKIEAELDLPTFAIPTPTGKNVTIVFSEALLGVLDCPSQNGNFLDASGLSLDSFDLPGYIKTYEDQFKKNIEKFDVTGFLGDSLSNVSSITGSISIAKDIESKVDSLKVEVTNVITAYYNALNISFSDFKYESSQFDQLNTILAGKSPALGPYTGANISRLAPWAYYFPNYVLPGEVTSLGPGQDFDTVRAALTATELNLFWGKYAYENTSVPPATFATGGDISEGIVFNLTKLNVGAPVYTHETYTDYIALLGELDDLVKSVNETQQYTKTIFNFQPKVDSIVNSFNSTYQSTIDSVSGFISNSIDKLTNRVTGVDILNCGFIGDYYRTVQTSYCGNLKTALGGTAVVSLVMVAALCLMFFIILYADCLAFRKSPRKGAGYDSDDDSSLDSFHK